MTDLLAHREIIDKATELAKSNQFKQALVAIGKIANEIAQNAEALYVRGVCYRNLQKFDEAVKDFQQVLELDADFARAHQEMGYVFLSLNRPEPAVNAFERAVSIDAALIGSWRMLSAIYKKIGDQQKHAKAQHEVTQLEQLHPALQAVKSNLNRNNIDTADKICRAYLQDNKKDVEGMRLLAEIAIREKILDDAEFILESAVAFDSKHIGARFDLANVLLKRQKFGEADQLAKALISEQADNSQFMGLLAATLMGVGQTQEAIDLLQKLIDRKVNLEHAYLLSGHAHKTLGNFDQSITAYKELYGVKPDFGDAFWSLANTKKYSFTTQEIDHIEDYRKRHSTSDIDKVHFNFALGKAYEDLQQYDDAFAAYEQGNRLNKSLLGYHSPEMQKRVARQKTVCNQQLFTEKEGVGAPNNDPIFIVGLPRAGSTLLEQILASHSQVDGTLELPNILSLSRKLRGKGPSSASEEPQYPKILTELENRYFTQFGEQYINDTQVFRQGAPFFIDKMPNNFLHIGLIKLILPNAKIIDARRHPMACCFSGFKQLFAEGQEFTYGLQEIGDYYRNYVEIMDHWDEVLPNYVLRVQHEDVVQDLETQVRRILDFCGLEFEQSCIEFYKTERNIRTPSAEQVRQPIYTTGLEQWRNFEKHLDPLIAALGENVLQRYPIS